MQALVYQDQRIRYLRDYPDPKPAPDEVLIAVETAGVCATDLEIAKGYMQFVGVLGHEFVGRVVKGSRELLEKRIVGEINLVCGRCEMCQSGLSNHCLRRDTLGIKGHDGVFADYVVLPRRNVHVIPDSVTNDQAVFVEPLAAAFQIAKQVPLESRSRVIVVGDGRLGLLVVQTLALLGKKSNIFLLGKHPDNLAFCEKRGLQSILVDDFVARCEWDIVVDCSGSPEGFNLSCRLVRPRGKLVLKSTWISNKSVDLTPLVIHEITLIGSRCGPFPDAINALAAARIETNGLITARFPLSEGLTALDKAAQPGQLKVVFDVKS